MDVSLIDWMGSDLTVVNAARVSFDKRSYWQVIEYGKIPGVLDQTQCRLSDRDAKLVRYLAEHKHWTPFAHCQVTLQVEAPIFVARQLGKHQVGMVWNEVSRRYVDEDPEFYEPDGFRRRAEDKKQGSTDETVDFVTNVLDFFGEEPPETTPERLAELVNIYAVAAYQELLDRGVCPEQARMVLPQSMNTEWYWTGSLAAWARVCKLRLDPHTQQETRDIAEQISTVMADLFPVSWSALMEN